MGDLAAIAHLAALEWARTPEAEAKAGAES